jgi:hypothetical protein
MEGNTFANPKMPPNATPKTASLAWARKLINEAKKPKGFSLVNAKRAMQLMVEQGKEPASFKVAPDGSFAIELVQVGKSEPKLTENPWDKVL